MSAPMTTNMMTTRAPLSPRLQNLRKVMAAQEKLKKIRQIYTKNKDRLTREQKQKLLTKHKANTAIIDENSKTTIFNLMPVELVHAIVHNLEKDMDVRSLNTAIGYSGYRIPYLYLKSEKEYYCRKLIQRLVSQRGDSKKLVNTYKDLMNPETLEYMYVGSDKLYNVMLDQKTQITIENYKPCPSCPSTVYVRDDTHCTLCKATVGFGKYENLTAIELLETDPAYATWLQGYSPNHRVCGAIQKIAERKEAAMTQEERDERERKANEFAEQAERIIAQYA
jgi:hypothetical protein